MKKAAEAKKKEEQKARKKAVDDAINKAVQLKNAYMKDYGCYSYKNDDIHNCPTFEDLLSFLM